MVDVAVAVTINTASVLVDGPDSRSITITGLGATGPSGGGGGGGAVTSVAARIGDVVLTKADVGLSNVDNTADASKVFTEAQTTNLVSDLAAKALKGLATFNVKTYGAVGDGTTDDAAAIQSAITACVAAGGGTVLFPAAVYACTTDIVVDASLVFLRGEGTPSGIYQGVPTTGAVLKRTGATAGSVVRFETPVAASTAISGGGMENIALNCASTAAKGLSLASVQWSTFRNIYINAPTTVGVDCFINTNAADAVNDTQGNIFERIAVRCSTVVGAIGIRLSGTAPNGNTSLNLWRRISVLHKNGVGVQFLASDSNTFVNLLVNRAAGGTGTGVEFNGTNVSTNHARSNSIFFLDPGAGGVTSLGTALTTPAVNNKIFGYSRENGAPDPVVDATSSLLIDGWFTGTGSPEGNVVAQVGSLYRNLTAAAGVQSYAKESGTGNTGWKALLSTASAIPQSAVTNLTSDLALKAPIASPTFTGITTAPEFSPSGLTGATSATRYVGGTASGAPASGTFAIGDWVITRDAHIFVCTVAGTPGTWVDAGSWGAGGGGVTSVDARTGVVTLTDLYQKLDTVTLVAGTNYTALTTDREIIYTSLPGNRTVTLPLASSFTPGKRIYIIDGQGSVGPNTITISKNVADFYWGLNVLNTAFQWLVLTTNGVDTWYSESQKLRTDSNLSDVQSSVTALTNLNGQVRDADLTTIAGLTATTDNFMIAVASAWASRTPAQAKVTLAITEADVANLTTDLAAKVPKSDYAAKGTILGGTGAGTEGGLVVGTIGQAVTALAAETTGLIYANPRSGADVFLGRTGAFSESIPRYAVASAAGVLTGGTLRLQAVYLPKGVAVANIAWVSGTTAANGPTNWWFGIWDLNRVAKRLTGNQTTTAWAASTEKIVALTSSFTTTYEGLHYLGILMTATTAVISLAGMATLAAAPQSSVPILGGNSTTGLTTPVAEAGTATAITTTSFTGYCYAS